MAPLTLSNSLEGNTTGDSRLDELLEQYKALMRRIIGRVCPRELRSSCDDIAQDAWIAIWQAFKTEREITYPGSYVRRVAVNATRHAIRRARARREEPLQEEGDAAVPRGQIRQASPHASPDKKAEGEEVMRKIVDALAQLPESRRRAVELYLQGLTTREVGEILGWSESKARNLVYRGREDLQKSLRAAGIEYR